MLLFGSILGTQVSERRPELVAQLDELLRNDSHFKLRQTDREAIDLLLLGGIEFHVPS